MLTERKKLDVKNFQQQALRYFMTLSGSLLLPLIPQQFCVIKGFR